MARVAGVSDDLPCFPHTSLGVDVLEGGKLISDDVLGRLNYSLQGFPVESGAVPIPGGDAASQDALHSANVELSACSGHAKTQPTLADSAPAPLFPAHFDAYSKVNLIFFPSPLVSQPLTPFCYKSGNLAGHHSCIEPLKTYTYSPCRMERSERNGESKKWRESMDQFVFIAEFCLLQSNTLVTAL